MSLQGKRAKTSKGKRFLEARAPKLQEDLKNVLLLHGGKSSQVLKDVLRDFARVKRGECHRLTRKNPDVRPFEGAKGAGSLEFLAGKADCGSFALGTHSKKRPHNLTLGRFFDGHVYDMVELGVVSFRPLQAFAKVAAQASGQKPCLLFAGAPFEQDPQFRQLRNTLLDVFRGQVVPSYNLVGLDRVLVFVAEGKRVLLRHYRVSFKRSGTRVPRVELEEMGPRLDLEVRRWQEPAPGVAKLALPKRDTGEQRKRKNVHRDEFEGQIGKVYVPKQDVETIALKKQKGAKRARRAEVAARKAEAQG